MVYQKQIKCFLCNVHMDTSEFTDAQIKKYSYNGKVDDNTMIRCRKHNMPDIKCQGPCGKMRPRTMFTGNRRQQGNATWCSSCLEWQLSDEVAHKPFAARDNLRSPDEIPDHLDRGDLDGENMWSRSGHFDDEDDTPQPAPRGSAHHVFGQGSAAQGFGRGSASQGFGRGSMPLSSGSRGNIAQGSTPQTSFHQGSGLTSSASQSLGQGSTPQGFGRGTMPQGSGSRGTIAQGSMPQASFQQTSGLTSSAAQSLGRGSIPQGFGRGSMPHASSHQDSGPIGSAPLGSGPRGITSTTTTNGATNQALAGNAPVESTHRRIKPTTWLANAFEFGNVREEDEQEESDDADDSDDDVVTKQDDGQQSGLHRSFGGLQLGPGSGHNASQLGQGHGVAPGVGQHETASATEDQSSAPHRFLPDVDRYMNTTHAPTSAPTVKASTMQLPPHQRRKEPQSGGNYNQIGPQGQVSRLLHAPTVGSTTNASTDPRGQPLRQTSNGSGPAHPDTGVLVAAQNGHMISVPMSGTENTRPADATQLTHQPYSTVTYTKGQGFAKPTNRKTDSYVAPTYLDRKKNMEAGNDEDDSADEDDGGSDDAESP